MQKIYRATLVSMMVVLAACGEDVSLDVIESYDEHDLAQCTDAKTQGSETFVTPGGFGSTEKEALASCEMNSFCHFKSILNYSNATCPESNCWPLAKPGTGPCETSLVSGSATCMDSRDDFVEKCIEVRKVARPNDSETELRKDCGYLFDSMGARCVAGPCTLLATFDLANECAMGSTIDGLH